MSAGDHRVRPYVKALNKLSRNCQEPKRRLADFAANVMTVIKDETGATVPALRIVREVTRAIPKAFGRTKCLDIFTSYALLSTA